MHTGNTPARQSRVLGGAHRIAQQRHNSAINIEPLARPQAWFGMPFRLTIRALTRNPGFSVLAVWSLAVGIGLATALGSIADAILFRPLPVARPNQVVRIFTSSPGSPLGLLSYLDYRDLSENSSTLTGVVAETRVM